MLIQVFASFLKLFLLREVKTTGLVKASYFKDGKPIAVEGRILQGMLVHTAAPPSGPTRCYMFAAGRATAPR